MGLGARPAFRREEHQCRLGGTVNDVVLAAITRAFRQLLVTRGEDVESRIVRTPVPAVRRRGERGTYSNRVSAMFAGLRVGIEDPVERLSSIREQMEGLKQPKQAVAGEVLTSLTGLRARVATRARCPRRLRPRA